jgi:hypothetical protein
MLLAASFGSVAPALAEDGRPVTIHVINEQGEPIPNATVRVPGTEGTRLVNRNGEWTQSMLYTVEGDEYPFQKNEFIEFVITAPEYHAGSIRYRVRGRYNYVEVALRRMPPPTAALLDEDDRDLLIRWFQRTEVEGPPQDEVSVQKKDK